MVQPKLVTPPAVQSNTVKQNASRATLPPPPGKSVNAVQQNAAVSADQAALDRKSARMSKTLPMAPQQAAAQFLDILPPRKGNQIPKVWQI